MVEFTGNCLCGAVSYKASGDPRFMANCHCSDCRKTTGAVYGTLVFMRRDNVQISGDTTGHSHQADSGNTLTKDFCPTCGSQMFMRGERNTDMIGIRAGSINEHEFVKPKLNVYASGKLDSTPLDPELPAPEKMPG